MNAQSAHCLAPAVTNSLFEIFLSVTLKNLAHSFANPNCVFEEWVPPTHDEWQNRRRLRRLGVRWLPHLKSSKGVEPLLFPEKRKDGEEIGHTGLISLMSFRISPCLTPKTPLK